MVESISNSRGDEGNMAYSISLKERKVLMAKMAEALKDNLAILSTDFQKILVDDLVTAFQNRINVLIRIQQKTSTKEN